MEEAPILHSEASGVRVFDGPGQREAVRMAYLLPVIRFASSATAEVLLPALDTPCHSPMRSVPDRSIHQSKEKRPGVSRAPPAVAPRVVPQLRGHYFNTAE
jgi:hypothetical protein